MRDGVDVAIRWLIVSVAVMFSAACLVWLLMLTVQAAEPSRRTEECTSLLQEEDYILLLYQRGDDFAAMRARALKSTHLLTPERFDKIMKLIDSAEKSGDVKAWFDDYWRACMDGI